MTHRHQDSKSFENPYLWDGSGPIDLEVAALERTLAPLRYRQGKKRRFTVGVAVASIAAMAALLVWFPAPKPLSDWTLGETAQHRQLHSGQVITTTNEAPAHIHSRRLGTLTVEPNSSLRLLHPDGKQERFALDYGTIRAFIWAPPAQFAVVTPSATAIDLGCVYTLQSDIHGDGQLAVEAGWVALQSQGLESFIPAGARCRIRGDTGPGIPVYDDATSLFRERFLDGTDLADLDLTETLRLARPKDALSLWHLLPRTHGSQRAQVIARFSDLAPLPSSVRAADLLQLRPEAMDGAWDSLQLGSTHSWRTWKRPWQAEPLAPTQPLE
ncbi:MAG: hypothetical protein KIT83_06810 [Bryobacterales bacterium]|nr:hypothetical protein [Bryobacterales bacterium]